MRIIVQKRRMHTFDSHCSSRVWKNRMTIFGIQGRNPFGLRPTTIENDVFPKSKKSNEVYSWNWDHLTDGSLYNYDHLFDQISVDGGGILTTFQGWTVVAVKERLGWRTYLFQKHQPMLGILSKETWGHANPFSRVKQNIQLIL